MSRVLVLRPEPGASATVEGARRRGLDAVAVPLFSIDPVAWDPPEAAFDGLLLTSANAVRCGGEKLQSLRGLPAYTVGEATAEAAREAGFDIADEAGVGLDAADDQDVVGTVSVLIKMNRKTFSGLADDDGFHAGADGAAAIFFGDAVAFD